MSQNFVYRGGLRPQDGGMRHGVLPPPPLHQPLLAPPLSGTSISFPQVSCLHCGAFKVTFIMSHHFKPFFFRVCVNYLSSRATFSDWIICPEHQRLLLDSWKPGNSCCHHQHREAEETDKPLATVSFAMSRDILRRDGMVLPIGGAVCQPCRQRYIQQHIPGLNSIHAISKPSTQPSLTPLPPSTPPRPAISLSTSSSKAASGPLSPEEIKRKISSLQPLQVISSPASSGRQKFFVLQPNQDGPVETVVFEDTSASGKDKDELVGSRAGEEREDSPISDCGSITVKEERIMVEDPELEEENKTTKRKKNKKKKAETSTPNVADTQASTEIECQSVETSEMGNEQAQGAESPTSQDSTGTQDTQNTETTRVRETVDAGMQKSEEYRFFCKLCHIGFLKETSYKYHFANNIELHKKMKRTTGKERKCDDCGKSFASDKLFRKHMYNDHKLDDPFFCKICNIVLKNESAYKSHHSKLHLERRTKICYCRECEEIFTCKVEHQEHILIHWEELGDEEGFQCSTCGKVFGSGNQSAYLKHLATHDDEVQKACDCPLCLEEEGNKKGKKRKAPPLKPINNKKSRSDVLEATTKNFSETVESEENNVDNPDEVTEEDEGIAEINGESDDEESVTEASEFSVNCGVCGNSFKDIDKLESHIASAHGKENEKRQFPFTAREGGWECHLCHSVLRTSRELKSHKANRDCSMLKEAGSVRESTSTTVSNDPAVTTSVDSSTVSASSSTTTPSTVVRTSVTALWQQSESRNWAAQFGYGKAKPKDNTNEDSTKELFKYKEPKTNSARKKENKKKEGGAKTVKAGDILSAMKMKFGGGDEVEDEEEIEGDDSFLYGSKRVESRRTETQGEPRVLSAASRQTRKRLELLTKQAQSLMKQREKQKAEKLKKKQTEALPVPPAKVTVATPAETEKSPNAERRTSNLEAVSNNNAEDVQEVSDDDLDLQADINNEDDLLIPLTNGWVCEKRRDITVRGGYVTHYWSPEGDHFKSREEIQQHVDKNQLSVDMAGFDAADINVRETEKQGKQHAAAKMTSVRVKDEETGLPMVIIFPGGRDCLTMDVTATA